MAEDRGLNNTTSVPYSDDIPVATISSSPIIDNQPSLVNDYAENSIYLLNMIDIKYVSPQKVIQLPITGNTTLCSFAYTAAPIVYREVVYEIISSAGPPALPAIYTNDPNDVLLGFELIPSAIDLEVDAINPRYMVRGKYVYGYKDSSLVTYYQGALPYVNIPFEETAISNDQFLQGIASPLIINSKSSGSPNT